MTSPSTSLERKDFIATDSDIKTLAQTVVNAAQEADTGRKSYLKVLIATTQHELGAKPRERTGTPSKMSAEASLAQIKALVAVHDRFYAIVSQAASEAVPLGTKDRGIVINKRTNFARTALSAVRRWLRAGNDLTALAAKSATKASLATSPRRVRASAAALTRRADRESRSLAATLKQLAKSDQDAARDELKAVVARLSKQLGLMPRTRLTKAVAETRIAVN